MTALGLVNTLRAKTRLVDTSSLRDDDYGWGTCKVRETNSIKLGSYQM